MNLEIIAVQCESAVRATWFKDSAATYYDAISFKSSVKLSLEDCLTAFTTSEKLGADDTW